jgi:thioredoxin 1
MADIPMRRPSFSMGHCKDIAMRIAVGAILFWSAGAAFAAGLPYNENAHAAADVREARQAAAATGRDVLIVFGANWCLECREVPRLVEQHADQVGPDKVVLVKVDVGNFDRNMDVVKSWGTPTRKGIPAAVLYRPRQGVVYSGLFSRLLDPYARFRKLALAALAPVSGLGLLLVVVRWRRRQPKAG